MRRKVAERDLLSAARRRVQGGGDLAGDRIVELHLAAPHGVGEQHPGQRFRDRTGLETRPGVRARRALPDQVIDPPEALEPAPDHDDAAGNRADQLPQRKLDLGRERRHRSFGEVGRRRRRDHASSAASAWRTASTNARTLLRSFCPPVSTPLRTSTA